MQRHRDNCPAGCTAHARACPRRTGGGLVLTELKTAKSRRTIALPAALVHALKAHRAAQLAERMAAGSRWQDGDFVWCQSNGRPIGAHADWDDWKALLKTARVRDARLHDARHTAATQFRPGRRPAGRDGDPRPLTDQHDHPLHPRPAAGPDRRRRPHRPGALGNLMSPTATRTATQSSQRDRTGGV